MNRTLINDISTKPLLGFAGLGWIGRLRLQALEAANIAIPKYLFDPSPDCIAAAHAIVPAAAASENYDTLLTRPELDALVIATPSALHASQAIAALRSGKAVFCQKPIGRNADEVANVLAAARQHNKLLMADFSYRYTQAFRSLCSVVQSGDLGKMFAVNLVFHNAYGPDKPWFFDRKQSGGGCVLDLGVHLIDMMLVALRFPNVGHVESRLSAKGQQLTAVNEVEDYATVRMVVEDTIDVQMGCSWNLHAGTDAIIEVSFYGTNGAVSMKNINGSFFDFETWYCKGTSRTRLAEAPDDWGGRALIDFAQRLTINDSYDNAADNYLQSALIVDRIYERQS